MANGTAARVHFASAEAQAPRPAALTSTRTLRRGTEGADVRNLQNELNLRGANIVVDGDFGPQTQKALKDFQRRSGIGPDGVVGRDTREAFRRTAADGEGISRTNPMSPTSLRQGAEGPAVESLQRDLNEVAQSNLTVDGDFGRRTRNALIDFQERAGIDPDGVLGPATRNAIDEVKAGTRELATRASVEASTASAPRGPNSSQVRVGQNTFNVHDQTRSQFGTRSRPGNRIIALDANSVSGREEVLRPLVVIPDNATRAERAAAQASVDRVAEWLNENTPPGGPRRHTTGIIRTTSQNGGRGLNGFFHTEFHSVNDTEAANLIKQRPQEYARILGETLGAIPGANFIVPHGNVNRSGIRDPGAVSRDGSTSEIGLGRLIIREGFMQL